MVFEHQASYKNSCQLIAMLAGRQQTTIGLETRLTNTLYSHNETSDKIQVT